MTVAVAHHDSAEGRAALRAAARQARLEAVPLSVLHVVDDDPQGDTAARRSGAEARVAADVEALDAAEREGLQWSVEVVAAGGDVASALIDLVRSTGASLIVIGTRRRSPVGKLLLGSVVQRVVIDAPVPVLTVKP